MSSVKKIKRLYYVKWKFQLCIHSDWLFFLFDHNVGQIVS